MSADVALQSYENETVLYMAMELSKEQWRLAFGDGSLDSSSSSSTESTAAIFAYNLSSRPRWISVRVNNEFPMSSIRGSERA